MATLKELALKYFTRIKKSKGSKSEIESIIDEINSLNYSESNKPISNSDKERIISIIKDLIKKDILEDSDFLIEKRDIEKAYNNEKYLDLIEYIKNKTKGK